MTNDIDWEVKMEALDASLPRRLERAAQMAERSDIWTDTGRLMPATGVADLIWEAHSEILGWRALNEERKASRTCPLGEDCDLTVAWMAGRESAKDEAQGMVAAALEEAERACERAAYDGTYPQHDMVELGCLRSRDYIRALIPDAGAALDRALEKAREKGRREGQIKAGAIFATSGAEDRWLEDMESACPACGGSGHKDDAAIRARADHGEKK